MGSALSRLAERLAPPAPPPDPEEEGGNSVGGGGLGTGMEEEETPSSSGSSSRGLALAALTGQTAVAGITGRSSDSLVQKRRLTKLEAQLASLCAQHAALQLQRSEAAVALEEVGVVLVWWVVRSESGVDRSNSVVLTTRISITLQQPQAEAFRHSLSTQLLHLLHEAEGRVQQRMREAARTHLLPGQHRPTVVGSERD